MTINERVSDVTLNEIIQLSTEFLASDLATGGQADLQPWLNEVWPEVTLKLARELQQYRAAAEPVAWVMKDDLADTDIISTPAYLSFSDAVTKTVGKLIPLYAAPQVTSVQSVLDISRLEDVLEWIDSLPVPTKSATANYCRLKNFITDFHAGIAAPAVKAEQTVSQPLALSATQFKPVADLYGIVVPGGRSTSYSTDAAEASDCRVMGWDVQEFVRLERLQEYITGNYPAISDGYALVPLEPTLSMLTILGFTGSFESMKQRYESMLSAAPQGDK